MTFDQGAPNILYLFYGILAEISLLLDRPKAKALCEIMCDQVTNALLFGLQKHA